MALVEFAIVVPLLALLLIGLVEIGRFAYFSIAVGNAARAGAQYGAFSAANAADATGIKAAAKADGQNNIKIIDASSQVVCSCWNSATGTETPAPPASGVCGQTCTSGVQVTYVQVDTTGSYSSMFRYPMLPSTFSVSARAVMRVHI